MPIGGYRFRRSFGNVRSRFRGALQKNFPFYVISGRVLDLFRKFTSSDTTIPDISGEGNDATLYTGRFLSTDGVSDRGILADCSAAGLGTYYLTGKVRPVGTTAWVGVSTSEAQNMTGLTAGVWQDFQSQTFGTFPAATPSLVTVGGGSTFYSAGDWSDIRLINAATGETVAHWQLNESADADLDGYPALDSSGNGYHGTHTGCAGGTGETTILQTAGMDWNKYQWFNGVDTNVDLGVIDVTSYTSIEVEVSFSTGLTAGSTEFMLSILHSVGDDIRVVFDVAGNLIAAVDDGTAYELNFGTGYNDGQKHTINFTLNGSGLSGTVDGSNLQTNGSATFNFATAAGDAKIGARFNDTFPFGEGVIYGIEISNQSGLQHAYAGLGNTPWKDTIGSNDGTESGTFTRYLVPESDTTAGEDALGNAIALARPNSKVFNGFDTGEYWQVLDDASLDANNTLAGWIYYDGTDATFFDYSGGGDTVTLKATSGNLVAAGLTTPVYYVGDTATTMSNTAALGAAGWKYIAVTYADFTPTANLRGYQRNGLHLIYTDTKVLADLETNRAVTKSQF